MGTTPPPVQGDPGTSGTGSEIKLATRNVSPPVAVYVDNNAALQISIFNAAASMNVLVSWRMLLPTGETKVNEQLYVPGTTRAKGVFQAQLTEGFLLGLQVNAIGSAVGNRTYVQVLLAAGQTRVTPLQLLCEGYISPQRVVFWPNGQSENSTDGLGAFISVTGTLPGAGLEIAETVPSHALWRLIAFRYSLTTSATVATRQSDLLIDDGSNTFAELTPPSTQAASLTQIYNWVDGAANETVANGIITAPGPRQVFLPSGFRIRTNTANLQAADQYTAPQYLVEEWLFQ